MNYYSQIDPRYKDKKISNSKLTIEGYGCFLCSIATLAQVDPIELMEKAMKEPYGFTSTGLLYPATLARLSRMTYDGRFTKKPTDRPCIAVTDHYAQRGVASHFFVLLEDGQILDPLDYPVKPKVNPYKIKEYRIFSDIKLKMGSTVIQDQIALNSELWESMLAWQTKLNAQNNALRDELKR